MKIIRSAIVGCVLAASSAVGSPVATTPEAMRSPVNQVFQFTRSDEFTGWADGTKTSATAFLWIPENCRKLRGLLILCSNVPEHMLVGHPAIRAVCAANDLGIAFFPKSFYNFKSKSSDPNQIAFLQQILDGLAKTSGYEEVATVPWLPIGESGHLLMVDALTETAPDRCLAGIWLKNNHTTSKNWQTPSLVIFGSAQEWSQDKADYRTLWNNVGGAYSSILNGRKNHPEWPLTYLIDGTSGHFDCSERLTQFVAKYIGQIAKARLPADGGTALRPVVLDSGFLADLPVPGHENHPATACKDTPAEARALPWFFDRASAEEAQSVARINWSAESQLPAYADGHGSVFPFLFNGITWMELNHLKPTDPPGNTPPMTLETEADGITFTVKGVLLDKLPDNFKNAGEPLARTPGEPTAEWMCGCVEPLGGNRFRLALDRTWPSPIYIALRQPGSATVRAVVQPGQIGRDANTEGTPQKIAFEHLGDVKAGTTSVPLSATADSGLPVGYFVVVGPAVVKDGKLVFTSIPPRAKLPITVTVAAWQWGRYAEPKIKRADIVQQSFVILPR